MMRWLLIALVGFITLLFVFRQYSFDLQNPHLDEKIYKLDEDKLFELTQKLRTEKGLNSYVKSVVTCGIASLRSEEVLSDYSHEGFLSKSQDWMKKYNVEELAENLARNNQSEDATILAWLSSPKHKENILKPFTDSCIKCKREYCVQIFARY